MYGRLFTALLGSAGLVATIATAQAAGIGEAQASAPGAAQPAATQPKKICRRELETGSSIPERHCHTPEEWAALDKQHDAEVRSVRDERGWNSNGH